MVLCIIKLKICCNFKTAHPYAMQLFFTARQNYVVTQVVHWNKF